MFNSSANHLVLISRTEYSSDGVFLMRDHDTQPVYQLYDFFKAQLIRPDVAYCIVGKVNSADKLYLVSNRSGRTPNTAAFLLAGGTARIPKIWEVALPHNRKSSQSKLEAGPE